MRYLRPTLFAVAVAIVGIGCGHITPKQKTVANAKSRTRQKAVRNHEPAAMREIANAGGTVLPNAEPLLLLEEGSDNTPTTGSVADNSRCSVCHLNYMQEDIAVMHARANIGCADCHGNSDAHIADESWSWGGSGTAPDIMYSPEAINPFCMSCHPRDKIAIAQHEPLFAGAGKEKYCTDCHGKHRLAQRRCKWK